MPLAAAASISAGMSSARARHHSGRGAAPTANMATRVGSDWSRWVGYSSAAQAG